MVYGAIQRTLQHSSIAHALLRDPASHTLRRNTIHTLNCCCGCPGCNPTPSTISVTFSEVNLRNPCTLIDLYHAVGMTDTQLNGTFTLNLVKKDVDISDPPYDNQCTWAYFDETPLATLAAREYVNDPVSPTCTAPPDVSTDLYFNVVLTRQLSAAGPPTWYLVAYVWTSQYVWAGADVIPGYYIFVGLNVGDCTNPTDFTNGNYDSPDSLPNTGTYPVGTFPLGFLNQGTAVVTP